MAIDIFDTPKKTLKKIPGDEYVLHMNAETAQIVINACELYARLRCGQFEEVQYLTVWPQAKDANEHDPAFGARIQRCREYLNLARKEAFPELASSSYHYGIGKFRDADTAWNVYQVVRYIKAWHEYPEGGVSVSFHAPMKYSNVPMPWCEVRSDDMDRHEGFLDSQTGELADTDQSGEDLERKHGDR